MAGIAKGARPAPDARSRPARHRHCGWQRTVGRDPVGRDAVRLGIASGRNAGGREIERGLVAFSSASNGGLIVTASPMNTVHRDLIIALAARHKLPAIASNRLFAAGGGLMSFGPDRVDQIYYERSFVKGGGLISYGPDFRDQYRRAASYVDRILKGEKPADLPVQAPTKYELVINLKTAKTLGLNVPPTLLARADEVIE